jgi:hypothetical protein
MPPLDSSLLVRQMRVIWRDTFVVEPRQPDFLARSRAVLTALPCYVSDTRVEPESLQPEPLRVLERVSRSVAVIGHKDLLRFQFAPLRIVNLRPTLSRLRRPPEMLTPAEIEAAGRQADQAGSWITVTPILVLHRVGVGIMEYHVSLAAPGEGFTPEEAIEQVRLGIGTHLLDLPPAWRDTLPANLNDWLSNIPVGGHESVCRVICGLRDLSQVIAARLSRALTGGRPRRRRDDTLVRPARPTGSTTVVLIEVSPQPGADLDAYTAQHAQALRGIGAMDTYYRERSGWIVERDLADNLSPDSEAAFYLLGTSELILFNAGLPAVVESVCRRMHFDEDTAITYLYAHTCTLMEWVYIQEALLRAYIQRIDALVASGTPRRHEVIAVLQGALSDLIQYQDDITPYATRIEFLEKARAYHKLDQLVERFERKQDLLLDYSSEFYDFREARATEYLNWLVGITTGAALGDLIVNLSGVSAQTMPLVYLGVMLGSIAVVLIVLGLTLRRRA